MQGEIKVAQQSRTAGISVFRENLDEAGEIFLVPYLDGHLLYIPRIGMLALVDNEIAHSLQEDVARFQLDSLVLEQIGQHLSFPTRWKDILTAHSAVSK